MAAQHKHDMLMRVGKRNKAKVPYLDVRRVVLLDVVGLWRGMSWGCSRGRPGSWWGPRWGDRHLRRLWPQPRLWCSLLARVATLLHGARRLGCWRRREAALTGLAR